MKRWKLPIKLPLILYINIKKGTEYECLACAIRCFPYFSAGPNSFFRKKFLDSLAFFVPHNLCLET